MLRKKSIFVIILFIFITAACTQETEDTSEKEATFVRVVDGDTLIAEIDGEEEYVRLLLVDTPETKHPTKDEQPFGEDASQLMEDTFQEKDTIYLEYGTELRDQYDRILAYLYTEDGEMFNEQLLKAGLARVAFVFPPNDKYVDDFYELEAKAREENLGVWSIPDYVTDYGFDSDVIE